MEGDGKLTVAEWIDAPIPLSARQPSARRFGSPGVIGLIGTLLLHALVLQSALSGMQAHKPRSPDIPILGSTLKKSDPAPAETLVLIELPTVSKADTNLAQEVAAAGAAAKQITLAVIRPEPSPMIDVESLQIESSKDDESKASVDSGNGAELARLFGIYSGQIQARVERVWQRPRTPVNDGGAKFNAATEAEYFRCQVQIIQDSGGNVQEVLLPQCNGSVAWQRSLVTAIQQSSPLPAPPNPKVFSHAVMIEFTGYAYGAGGSDEGYERAPSKMVQTQPSINASHGSAQE